MEGGEAQAGSRQRILLTVGIAVGALAVIVGLALVAGGGADEPTTFAEGSVPPRQTGDLEGAAEAAGCELTDHESEGRKGTGEDVDYKTDPPNSGDHSPEPADDAAYRTDPPPDENLVHTLFHGRIVI